MSFFPDLSSLNISGGQFNAVEGNQSTTYNFYFLGDASRSEAATGASESTDDDDAAAPPAFPPQGPVSIGRHSVDPSTSHIGRKEEDSSDQHRPHDGFSTHGHPVESYQLTLVLELRHPLVLAGSNLESIQTTRTVWKVFDIPETGTIIKIPSPSIGFGTVVFSDEGEDVTSPQFLVGPPGSTVLLRYQHGVFWSPGPNEYFGCQDQIRASNMTGFPTRFAIGACFQDARSQRTVLQPIAITDSIHQGATVSLCLDFTLSLYRTNSIRAGQVIDDSLLRRLGAPLRKMEVKPQLRMGFSWQICAKDDILKVEEL